jgi:hypothetical protein
MKSFDRIDALLLARVESEWRKVAFVIGKTMVEAEGELLGASDLLLAERVRCLAASGKVESRGDLGDPHYGEIRGARKPAHQP